MDLRNFYKKILPELIEVPGDFYVSFPTRNFDASSNVLILISNLKNFPVENIYLEILPRLENSGLFENINFNRNQGVIYWNIPKKIWIHQLIATRIFVENFTEEAHLPMTVNKDKLLQIKYVYSRIHSVFRHFQRKFPDAMEYESANLNLISRKDIINLIKVMVSYPEWIMKTIKNSVPDFLYKYILSLADFFDQLWNSCDEKRVELCFILPNDLEQTKARILVLSVLAKILEKSSVIVGFSLEKELR